MLCNKVTCTRMETACEKGAQYKVHHCIASKGLCNAIIKGELSYNVEEMNLGQRKLVNEHRPKSIKEDLKGTEKGFAEDRVQKQSLESGR